MKSTNWERECLNVKEKTTLKLCCLRILAMEKQHFGKLGNMILTHYRLQTSYDVF